MNNTKSHIIREIDYRLQYLKRVHDNFSAHRALSDNDKIFIAKNEGAIEALESLRFNINTIKEN